MSASQREERRAMIKRRRTPSCCCMALRTVVTEVARYMIRICRLLKLRRMTLVAIRVMQLVVTIHVT